MHDGTGAGSAQRDVGVVGVSGLSVSGFLFGVMLLRVMVGSVVSAVSVWLALRATAVEVGGVIVIVDEGVVVVGVALNLLVVAVWLIGVVMVVLVVLVFSAWLLLPRSAAVGVVGVIVVVGGGLVFVVVVVLLADSSMASQSMSIFDLGVVGVAGFAFGVSGSGVGGLGIGLSRGWCLCP